MEDERYDFKIIPTFKRYYNSDTYYGVYLFKTKDKMPHLEENNFDEETFYFGTLAGKMQQLTEDIEYDLKDAKLVYNKKYNQWQYECGIVTVPSPNSIESQKAFLKAIITEKQADVLLEAYPNIVQDVMEGKEIDLSKTKGIKEATFKNIEEKILENYVIADILTLLQPLGVTIKTIKKLTNNEPNPVILKQKLIETPYMLTKIHGLGWTKVDDLALKLNPKLRISEQRVKAFITYYLNSVAESEGHTWISRGVLTTEVKNEIKQCMDIYRELIEKEIESPSFLYVDDTRIGLKKFYNTEKEIFSRLNSLNEAEARIKDVDIDEGIELAEKEMGFFLTEEQKIAIKSIEDNNVVVITAAAGSGKTITTNAILKAYENKARIVMCALSAKAAQRMKEVSGYEATTIHRLLGFGEDGFAHDENCPLDADVVVLDEASMVNQNIFLSLIKAIPKGSKFIIVFDFAQLPPIGAGNIASDLLNSKNVKINKLTKVHRQAEASGILMDANKIRQGINPLDKPEKSIVHGELKDMFYKFRESKESLRDLAINTFMLSLKKTSLDDIVLISPRKKDCINSTREINKILQDMILPDEKTLLKRSDMYFKLGAKVIQKVNDYDRMVTNGEIGYISYIDMKKSNFEIKFPDKIVEYDRVNLSDIELAYSLTVHSAQGSQWNTVICVFDTASFKLLDSTLLYTALTRASKRCMLICDPKGYIMCIKNNKAKIRQTFLKEFYDNEEKREKKIVTKENLVNDIMAGDEFKISFLWADNF